MAKLSASILSADFSKLGEDAILVSRLGTDYLHIDVMDGHYVPNISFGPTVMKSLDKLDTAPYDIHLMIEDPDKYIPEFVTEKTEYITVHQESCVHLHRTIEHIKSYGVKAGVSINPATSISALESIIEDIDLVLIMSVNPGFSGQKFIEHSMSKIKKLHEIRTSNNLHFEIEVDGGVNLDNINSLKEVGCDIVVAGSAVFNAKDVNASVSQFLEVLH